MDAAPCTSRGESLLSIAAFPITVIGVAHAGLPDLFRRALHLGSEASDSGPKPRMLGPKSRQIASEDEG